ncbi:MAG TPA: SDR family oxidoreductase [Candidatus Acidoferrales bacterium]|nr:SDR family oxidoreductase [Candidatus Acidoferrales bacterium]
MTHSAAIQQPSTVLITGATDGLGRAMAVFLAANGYRVFAAGRSAEKRASLDQLAAERKLLIETLDMDVADDASVSRAVARVLERAGRVDVLINNAGIAYVAVLEEIRLDDLRRQFETNVFGLLRVTQAVLPAMRERRAGRILNVSSIAGKIALPLMGPYASSKHAVEGLSDSLRLELAPFGVRVILIEPGFIPTNMSSTSLDLSSAYASRAEKSPYASIYRSFRDMWKQTTTAARTTPEDCARVVLRALLDTPPRARYTVTPRARVGVVLKRFLPDRMLDRRILRSMGLDKPL